MTIQKVFVQQHVLCQISLPFSLLMTSLEWSTVPSQTSLPPSQLPWALAGTEKQM